MCPSGTAPPNQRVTPDEILVAIEELCDKRGVPVVRSKDIADLDDIPVGRQAVNEHLDTLEKEGKVNCLSVQRSAVWWVSEDHDTGGEADISAVDWENIDPEEIPLQLIKERPEVEDPNYWERTISNWETVAGAGVFFLAAGLLLAVLEGIIADIFGVDASNSAALLVIGGFVTMIGSLTVILIAKIGDGLENIGVNQAIRDRLAAIRIRILRAIARRVPSDLPKDGHSDKS